jgi:hypothetical protein
MARRRRIHREENAPIGVDLDAETNRRTEIVVVDVDVGCTHVLELELSSGRLVCTRLSESHGADGVPTDFPVTPVRLLLEQRPGKKDRVAGSEECRDGGCEMFAPESLVTKITRDDKRRETRIAHDRNELSEVQSLRRKRALRRRPASWASSVTSVVVGTTCRSSKADE